MDESVSIFFVKLVSFIHRILVAMLESFPVFGFDAFTYWVEI